MSANNSDNSKFTNVTQQEHRELPPQQKHRVLPPPPPLYPSDSVNPTSKNNESSLSESSKFTKENGKLQLQPIRTTSTLPYLYSTTQMSAVQPGPMHPVPYGLMHPVPMHPVPHDLMYPFGQMPFVPPGQMYPGQMPFVPPVQMYPGMIYTPYGSLHHVPMPSVPPVSSTNKKMHCQPKRKYPIPQLPEGTVQPPEGAVQPPEGAVQDKKSVTDHAVKSESDDDVIVVSATDEIEEVEKQLQYQKKCVEKTEKRIFAMKRLKQQ